MITLISGTNRPDSNTRKITAIVQGIYEKNQIPVRTLDLADLPRDLFSPASYGEKPAAFEPFSRAVVESSGLVVITPEYNGGMPGVLKYFIDMLPFPESFQARPVCFIGLAAGMWGALRPVEHLQQIFGYRNAFIYPERVFIPGVGGQLTSEGTLKNAELYERLNAQATGFATFASHFLSAGE
ncbi:MAG: NAD(P)H-dependent oxidoreductase [Candidatus Methylacidiphilales bacterium]|nr:NAD(P)H-dependent oxidoreductase [Candidatus Methylacidiphilales bacterium]